MGDFDARYRCPCCGRRGAPISDEASGDEYRRGWHVTCPRCGFSISGPSKAFVVQSAATLAERQARIDAMLGAPRGEG